MQVLLLLGGEDVQCRQVLAEQQRGLLDPRQPVSAGGEFGEHLGEGGRRHGLAGHAELGEQQRLQARHQVQVQHPVHAGADQRVDLVAGGAVAHQAVGVDRHRGAGEDLRERQGRVDLDRLDRQRHVVVAQPPLVAQETLPERQIVPAGRPAARMEREDRLVVRDHVVEAVAQLLEAGRLVQRGRGLGRGRVVADQQDPPVGRAEAAGVQGGGKRGRAVQRRRLEDLGGHAAAPAGAGRRRSRRSLVARWRSMESSASSSTSCGMRRRAAALMDFSFFATAGSNLSMDPR